MPDGGVGGPEDAVDELDETDIDRARPLELGIAIGEVNFLSSEFIVSIWKWGKGKNEENELDSGFYTPWSSKFRHVICPDNSSAPPLLVSLICPN